MKILSQRIKILLALGVIFVGPVIVAFFMYDHPGQWSVRTLNKGDLLQPVVPLDQYRLTTADGRVLKTKQFAGKWILMYLDAADCDHDCQENLYKMHQVQQALGKYHEKISRLVITQPGVAVPKLQQLLAHEYAGMQQGIGRFDLARNAIYIVDPRGNIILHYANHVSPKAMLYDLKRLLRYAS